MTHGGNLSLYLYDRLSIAVFSDGRACFQDKNNDHFREVPEKRERTSPKGLRLLEGKPG